MEEVWIYSLVSVAVVSLITLAGLISFKVNERKLQRILIYLISFSAGALFGDAFIHLLPETIEFGFTLFTSASILFGILVFFVIEKIMCWQHCHMPITNTHIHRFAYMNLLGDSVHNFIDGLIIASSYIASIPVGIATTIAVIFHEIPQEIGDFGVLVYGGFSKIKAIMMNFLTALTAILGVIAALFLNNYISGIQKFLIPLAIGGFIYIAGSDLIPELHKETNVKKSFIQIISFVIGVLIMASLLLLG
jgi:zinc and cadmium transporter